MTILYVLMFVTGVTGNFAVCIVIVRNKTMHTATNYYLFSLAISDLIILLLGKLIQSYFCFISQFLDILLDKYWNSSIIFQRVQAGATYLAHSLLPTVLKMSCSGHFSSVGTFYYLPRSQLETFHYQNFPHQDIFFRIRFCSKYIPPNINMVPQPLST